MVYLAVVYSAATTRNTFRTICLSHPCSLHGLKKERMGFILEFIYYASDWKITSKSTCANRITLIHWTSPNNDFSYTICKGCELSSWKSETDDCIIQKLRSLLKVIPERLLSYNKPAGTLRTTPMH